MLAGREIRRRWRSTLAIALLIGVVGALVLATVAGARRSATSLSRFNAVSRSADLELSIDRPTARELAEFRRSPGVAEVSHLRGYTLESPTLPNLAIAAPLDDVLGRSLDRDRLVAGRRPDQKVAEEIDIGESLAQRKHLHVGSHFSTASYSQEQIEQAFAGGNPGDPGGPTVRFRVVGIVRRPLDLGVRSTSGGVLILTRAFATKYDSRVGAFTDVLRVRTVHGKRDLTRVIASARKLWGDAPTFGSSGLGIETEGARSAIDVLTLALWVIAGVSALAGAFAIGIVLGRDMGSTDLDQATLRGLGLTRGQRIATYGPRSLLIAGLGALLAAAGAVLLSRFFPIGVARRADPDPGLHADWTVLAIGVPLIAGFGLAAAYVSALRLSCQASFERAPHAYRRTSTVVTAAANAGVRPAALNGLRMAVQSGHGDSAVPVRSAFLGAVFGVAGITAALVFAASLTHLVDTPKLYGWTWNVRGEVPTAKPCVDARSYGMEKQSGVAAIGVTCITDTDVEMDGHAVTVWGFRSLHGTIDPEIVAGRAPRGQREIALGSVTLDAIGKSVGDSVTARGPHRALRYKIVGQVVLPALGTPQPLADGAAVTTTGFTPLYAVGENPTHYLLVRMKPGRDPGPVEQKIAAIPGAQHLGRTTVPVEVTRLRQVDRMPAVLAALLGVLALIAVGHAVVTAVRRRRTELALLKVLGFTRREIRATIAWQASIIGAVGLGLGIPLGVLAGRGVWSLVADGLGIVPAVTNPLLWLAVTVPVVLALVNLIAFFPARSAARTRPAVALRSA